MMSGMPLDTYWAFSKFWNNKFYYKVESFWLFLLIHTTMHGSINIKLVQWLVFEVDHLRSILGWVINYLRHCIHTGSKANLVSYPLSRGVSSSGDLVVEKWNWPFTTISCQSYESLVFSLTWVLKADDEGELGNAKSYYFGWAARWGGQKLLSAARSGQRI
jgi:hypothetical protein